jgi:hypothetical protein
VKRELRNDARFDLDVAAQLEAAKIAEVEARRKAPSFTRQCARLVKLVLANTAWAPLNGRAN